MSGSDVAHQIINTGAVTLRDHSNKLAALSRAKDGKSLVGIGRASASLDHWDGEDIGEVK